MGSNAAKGAAKSQEKAAQLSTDEQRREYDQTRTDFQPYRDTGYTALNRLNQLTFGNPNGTANYESFYKSPGYEFQSQEGTRNIQRSAAARSGALSGNVLRDLTRFSSNLASTGFNDYYNRVKGLADIGIGATGQTAQAGSNMANNVSQNYLAQGDAQAAGGMGSANSWNNAANSGLNNYLLYRGGYFNKSPQYGGATTGGAA
jgi:hypothetical protein